MTEPAEFDSETMTFVILGGRPWPIPELLGWRTLSKCRAQLVELTGMINAQDEALPSALTAAEAQGRNLMVVDQVFLGLSNEDTERLVIAPIYAALVALHPALTRDEFDDLPVSEGERKWSWLAVRRASGLFDFASTSEPSSGEAAGAA